MTTQRTPGAERLHKARKAAARELGLKITDPAVIRLAILTTAYDQIQARIASGQTIDVDAMLKLDDALAEVRKASKPLPNLEIQFVRSVTGIFNCQHCGKRNEIPDHHPLPPPEDPPPIPEAASGSSEAVKAPPSKPAPFSRPAFPDGAVFIPEADPVSPMSVTPYGSGNNNWSWVDGGSGPFSDPNPVFRNGKSRY